MVHYDAEWAIHISRLGPYLNNENVKNTTKYLNLMSVCIYLADEKMMIAIATVVRAAATTPIINSTASNAFSPPMPEQRNTTRTASIVCMTHSNGYQQCTEHKDHYDNSTELTYTGNVQYW